jgi:hypothetical protein
VLAASLLVTSYVIASLWSLASNDLWASNDLYATMIFSLQHRGQYSQTL